MSDPYEINDQEFERVSGLDAPKRYEHFLKRICDSERIYLLAEEGQPVVLTDESGREASQLPLWPHRRYGEAYRERFGGAPLAEISLEELVEELLPGMEKDGIDAAVFPTADGQAPVVASARLRDDVLAYHEEWYGGWPKYSNL